MQLKNPMNMGDIVTELIILLAVAVFIVYVYRIYLTVNHDKAWLVAWTGIVLFFLGQCLDVLDEFYHLPRIIPRVIENSLLALGIVFATGGLVITFSKMIEILNKDETTKIYNKSYLKKALGIEIERSKRYNLPLSLIFVDLNGFKQVNDRWGHTTGDAVLCVVAEKIGKSIRKMDILSRYGGDEFVIILPHCDQKCAQQLLDRLKEEIASMVFHGEFRIGISGGIAEFPVDGDSVESLIDTADRRMYRDK